MSRAKIVITVDSEKDFNEEEFILIMKDIKARLQGYYTKPPECLKQSKMHITYEKEGN